MPVSSFGYFDGFKTDSRVQKDFYRNQPRLDAFAAALASCRAPVCYNGDLVTAADCAALIRRFPGVTALMAGRGAVADPALFSKARGGPGADRGALRAFHDELYAGYAQAFGSRRNATLRMKEFWSYLLGLFQDGAGQAKALRKAADPAAYEAAVNHIFQSLPLREDAAVIW